MLNNNIFPKYICASTCSTKYRISGSVMKNDFHDDLWWVNSIKEKRLDTRTKWIFGINL